ncbi:MAG: 3-deoxy-8-phosphooctulonate synthase [Phycisphaerales bacterium JB038]
MANTCVIGQHRLQQPLPTGAPFLLIAGPCVLETEELSRRIAATVGEVCAELGVPYVYKASFDKANRSSIRSPRGPGLERGLDALAAVREEFKLPITTDVHEASQAEPVAAIVDLLQIPAFLCRQTDLLIAAGEAAQRHGRAVSIKKGQFVSPREMGGPIKKLSEAGCDNLMLIERGTFFGYHRLVNDFTGLGDLMELGPPVCFDVTHSTQLPGAAETSGGRPERTPLLARAAIAAGVSAIFMECHPEPAQALSDASNVLPLEQVPDLLRQLVRLRRALA